MHREVTERLSDVRVLCEKHHVRGLWVFGSAVDGSFDPARSDLDFLVEFHPLTPVGQKNAYFGLLEDLTVLFGRPVDLAEPGGVRNPVILQAIEDSKVSIYAAA